MVSLKQHSKVIQKKLKRWGRWHTHASVRQNYIVDYSSCFGERGATKSMILLVAPHPPNMNYNQQFNFE